MERSQEAKKLLQSARAIISLNYETIDWFFNGSKDAIKDDNL